MYLHLLELRRRSIYVLLWFGSLFLLFFFLANDLFQVLVSPLLKILPNQKELIATQVSSPVFIPLKLAANTALLFSTPFALVQLWRFISPGLYKNERRTLGITLVLSPLLFILGILFCFYLVLPFMFQFFVYAVPKKVHYMPDITYTLEFITHMLLIFGCCFQVPLICFILVRLGIIEQSTLKKLRPYVIVAAFILGMIFTPPDVFSQIMLAVPLCLLYELGLILVAYLEP
jgi:sec-independent protein translocase protein TatC